MTSVTSTSPSMDGEKQTGSGSASSPTHVQAQVRTQQSPKSAVHVSLTHQPLDIASTIDLVRSPKAGAIVMFAGTTRDNFNGSTVSSLAYSAYEQLALQTMRRICEETVAKHGLMAIAMVHRLGDVPIGEESILIVVSSPHRTAAWRAGEEALERCKESVEVWKLEKFAHGGGEWRANRDGAAGERVA